MVPGMKVADVYLEPGDKLVVNGWYPLDGKRESTTLYSIGWEVSDGWALAECVELSDDSGVNVLVNNWELPTETPPNQL